MVASCGEGWARLDGAREELERHVVLLLQREAVAHCAAGEGRGPVELDGPLREVAQVHFPLEVPEYGRVDLGPLQPVGLNRLRLLEHPQRLGVLNQLEVRPTNLDEGVLVGC